MYIILKSNKTNKHVYTVCKLTHNRGLCDIWLMAAKKVVHSVFCDVSLQHPGGSGRGGRERLLEPEDGPVHGEAPPASLPRDHGEDLPQTLPECYDHALDDTPVCIKHYVLLFINLDFL